MCSRKVKEKNKERERPGIHRIVAPTQKNCEGKFENDNCASGQENNQLWWSRTTSGSRGEELRVTWDSGEGE